MINSTLLSAISIYIPTSPATTTFPLTLAHNQSMRVGLGFHLTAKLRQALRNKPKAPNSGGN